MVIRSEQIQAFSEAMRERFENRAMAHLRRRFAAVLDKTGDDALRKRIRAGMECAASYGIRAESDVMRYLEYTVEYGPDFDTASGWAPPILGAEGASGARKMDELDNWTTYTLRQ
jgi:hypothetical protein